MYVSRNPSGPVFERDPYVRQIHETFPVTGVLFNVTATDVDQVHTRIAYSTLSYVRILE